MPIEHRTGDLFSQSGVDMLLHVCNLHHCFGAGIAAIIKQKYPEAFEADCSTQKDYAGKLGTYSSAKCADGKTVVNLYAMPDFGEFSYDAFYKAITSVKQRMDSTKRLWTVVMPYAIGCGLAGGEFSIVYSIVEAVFFESPHRVVFCRLPGFPENPILKNTTHGS